MFALCLDSIGFDRNLILSESPVLFLYHRVHFSKPTLTMPFPPLPARDQPWSPQVYNSVQVLQDMYRVANEMLAQGNYDVSRILYHADAVSSGAVPLLFDLEAAAESEELPPSWVQGCAQAFHDLLQQLCEAENAAQGV